MSILTKFSNHTIDKGKSSRYTSSTESEYVPLCPPRGGFITPPNVFCLDVETERENFAHKHARWCLDTSQHIPFLD